MQLEVDEVKTTSMMTKNLDRRRADNTLCVRMPMDLLLPGRDPEMLTH